jgi:hypothetical protein
LIGVVVIGVGRYGPIVLMLALAGSLAAKKAVPVSAGTVNTEGRLFGGVLMGTIIIVGALVFFPVLAIGAIAEHFAMLQGWLPAKACRRRAVLPVRSPRSLGPWSSRVSREPRVPTVETHEVGHRLGHTGQSCDLYCDTVRLNARSMERVAPSKNSQHESTTAEVVSTRCARSVAC